MDSAANQLLRRLPRTSLMLFSHALLLFLLGTSVLAIPVPTGGFVQSVWNQVTGKKKPPVASINGIWRSELEHSQKSWFEVSEQHSFDLTWY